MHEFVESSYRDQAVNVFISDIRFNLTLLDRN